jgi:hypothetical protein
MQPWSVIVGFNWIALYRHCFIPAEKGYNQGRWRKDQVTQDSKKPK